MTLLHRRDFIKGCCVAAVAGGVGSRAQAYFAPPPIIPTTATDDTLVVVFLRGAMDGLSLLPPGAASPYRGDYESNRTNTRVPTSGSSQCSRSTLQLAAPLDHSMWCVESHAPPVRFPSSAPRGI